jgi:DNA-binding GntR family transcriptional regulator
MDLLDPLRAREEGPSESSADRVVERLREEIQLGHYAPGTRLVERSLAEEFDVSHIPVREALARLSEEGLVQRLPRRGARVAGLSPDMFEKLSDIRVLLERFVARRAHERLTPEGKIELDANVDAMVSAAQSGNVGRVLELDRQFHEQLVAIADHAILSEFVVQLRGRVNAFLKAATSSLSGRRLIQHAESHRRLLNAIADGPASRAEREAERHIRVAAKRVHSGFAREDDS